MGSGRGEDNVLETRGWDWVMNTFLKLRHMLEVMPTTTALNAFVKKKVLLHNERSQLMTIIANQKYLAPPSSFLLIINHWSSIS